MDAKSLADQLTGTEYPMRISEDLARQAKDAGLVIVYGASDDLMEFEGAIYDEIGACDGATVYVDAEGLVPDFESLDKDDKQALKAYFNRDGKGKKIEALWCAEGDYSFIYHTDIPHETFEVTEDGAPYCRGIVFRLADCAV
jgi:hypothetical protein